MNGIDMVRVTGVVAVKLPLDAATEVPWEHPIDQLASIVWLGLAVTVTVMMSGLLAVPLAAQMANSP